MRSDEDLSDNRPVNVDLPDWMRNPPPRAVTWRDRVGAGVTRLPGGAALRRFRWRWEQRDPLHRRFPRLTASLAVPLAFVAIMALISLAYWLYLSA